MDNIERHRLCNFLGNHLVKRALLEKRTYSGYQAIRDCRERIGSERRGDYNLIFKPDGKKG